MHQKCQFHGYNIRKEDVRLILGCLDPIGVNNRKARRLRRRDYYTDGPNSIWHIDGNDKLCPYGFGIHGCIDGYSRKIIWLRIYYSNSDPKLIGGYYIDAVEQLGGCPSRVRGDLGTENGYIKTFQNFFRNVGHGHHIAYLQGASTANTRIESFWGQLRKEVTDFYLCIFHLMQEDGDYVGDFVDKNLLLFCFMGILQVIFNIIFNHFITFHYLL